ncbi:MAG: hypothetical protein ACREU8_05250 [Gammaproteobacteria bacterium]
MAAIQISCNAALALGCWLAARAEYRAKRVERLSTDLGLNEEQKQKLTAFFDKLGEQRKAMQRRTDRPVAALQE